MEREEFIRNFNFIKSSRLYHSKEEILKLLDESIDSTKKADKFIGET